MKITHKIDTFLAELFPKFKHSNNDLEVLKTEIANYYTIGPFKPIVSIKEDEVFVEIDVPTIHYRNQITEK